MINDQKRISYTGLRADVISLINGTPANVLDVGCSNGVLLEHLKLYRGAAFTVGIELDQALAREASRKIDRTINADLDNLNNAILKNYRFDLIIFADVLEHVKKPEVVLCEILKSSSKNAQIIVSLPNVQHWTTIKNLLLGQWPQNDRGLFDRTHLHFFTLLSIREMADRCGLEIESVHRNYRIFDEPGHRINRFSRLLAFWPFKGFVTYQYVVRMRPI